MWKEEGPIYRTAPGKWQMWSGGGCTCPVVAQGCVSLFCVEVMRPTNS